MNKPLKYANTYSQTICGLAWMPTVWTLFLLLLMGCKEEKPPIQVSRLDGSTIKELELDQKILQLTNEAKVTGLGISIFNKGQTVYQKAFGYANNATKDTLLVDDVFYGASFSKAVFGYLVAQLVEEGILDLDTPLQDYLEVDLPDLPVEKEFRSLEALREDDRYKEITARMCMSHTAGFPNWRWIEVDKQLKFLHSPGERYSYSGEGIMLLQWVVEAITQRKLEDLAEEMVFRPLEMTHSSYLWKDSFEEQFCYGHDQEQQKLPRDIETEDAAAAGSLETTLADYSKFLEHILLLDSLQSPLTKNLFTPNVRIRSVAQFGPLASQDTILYEGIKLSYGLGWGLLTSPFGFGAFKEGHDEGFQHYSILFPEQQIGVLIMTNSDNGESLFKDLLEASIGDIYTPWQWENYIPYHMAEK